MIKPRLLALLLLPTFALATPTQEGVLLRLKLENGSTVTHTSTFKSKQVISSEMMGGEQEILVDGSMKMKQTISGVSEDGKMASLTIDVSDLKMEMGGAMAAMAGSQDMPKGYTIKAKIDDRNRMTDVKVEGIEGQMRMMMAQQTESMAAFSSVIFPEAPVKVGDTFEMELPPSMMYGKGEKLSAKFVGEKEMDGMQVREFAITGKVKMNMDVGKMMEEAGGDNPMSGMKMIMTGTMDVSSTAMVDMNGRLVRMQMKMTSDGKMEMPDMGMTMGVKGEVTSLTTIAK